MTVLRIPASSHAPGVGDAAVMIVTAAVLFVVSVRFENRQLEWGFKGGGGPVSYNAKIILKVLLLLFAAFILSCGIYVVVQTVTHGH
jgi:hypothetical protein